MGLFSWLFGRSTKTTTMSGSDDEPVVFKGPGSYGLDIVGESHYQGALEAICGGRTTDGTNKIVDAFLMLDDQNPYDKQAVAIVIEGKKVGHLSRENARQYRERLRQLGVGMRPAVCKAKIVGGWDRGGGDRGHFGVKLDLPIEE